MWSKIAPNSIIEGHLVTLAGRQADRKRRAKACLLAFGVPALPCLALLFTGAPADKLVDTTIAALSILAGLLFNLVILLFGQRANRDFRGVDVKDLAQVNRARDEVDGIQETYQNASFSIIVALAAIIFLVLSKIELGMVTRVLFAVACWLCLIFLSTLMMILNRVNTLFTVEAGNRPPPAYQRPETKTLIGP